MFMIKANNTKYGEVLQKWLESKRLEVITGEIKEQTYIKYYSLAEKTILPKLGEESFSKLSTKVFQNFFQSTDRKDIALSTQKTIFYIINASCHPSLTVSV